MSLQGRIVSLWPSWVALPAARLSTVHISSSVEQGSCFSPLHMSASRWS